MSFLLSLVALYLVTGVVLLLKTPDWKTLGANGALMTVLKAPYQKVWTWLKAKITPNG